MSKEINMDKWERLRIRLEENKTSAINVIELAERTHHHELCYFFKGKASAIAEILRTMEEIDNG